jgi:hypothetical protein
MAKIARNEPCPCGSGIKYKKCCGFSLKQPSSESTPTKMESIFKKHHAAERIRVKQQGLGKPIISTVVSGHQVVAVGNTIYYGKSWKVFQDFLSNYIKKILGEEWGNAEIAKPFQDRHTILKWYDSYCSFQRKNCHKNGELYSANAIGVVICYLGTAYNLYLLNHNVELQQRLIHRLKNIGNFQGAYYELIIANCLIRAGFELTLEDEADESSKHCEFSAISKLTGKKYWVEAKMRSVSGLLGKNDLDGTTHWDPTSLISKHLGDALKKPALDERLIFIDVNAPPTEEAGNPKWMEAAIRRLEDREKDLKDGQQAYVFVSNMPFHRSLNDEQLRRALLAFGLGIPDFCRPGVFRLTELYKRKQKHIDAHNIFESFQTYPNIPTTFDGSLPSESLNKDAMPIKIGETYFFEGIEGTGVLAEVTSATVNEAEKKIYFGVFTEEKKSMILTKDITDDALSDYKAHPDAYFGVYQQAPKKIKDPFDLFEWMIQSYKDTPMDKLLELCRDVQDFMILKELPREELVLELCERWTISAVASSSQGDTGS